ncbi:uncharacterized protein LOC133181379 [Saccostrea echinata]|uniref:uncharacterized protein LOC133181379 n=1 Tax=Saccostrea echinata TaxID=191078 RepID=UPI002A8351B1|nr:uncharacterized protein LOC133181379 [Saccostrea echinata]
MGEFEGNELAELHIYTQTFQVITKLQERAEAEKRFQSYINRVLNEGDDEIGIVFYKGQLFSHPPGTDDAGKYSIEFYLLSLKHWDAQRRNSLLTSKIFKEFTENFATLEREVLKQQTVCLKRDPVSFDDHAEDLGQVPGCTNIEGDNCCEKCLNFWLIVPRVQWDFFDLLYQMYTFDIFHQGMLAKFVHFFTIPTNVMLSMMFLAQFNIYGELRYGNAFSVNGALILFGVLSIAYIIMGFIRKCVLWGVATTVVLAVLNMAGNLWYYSYRTVNNPWYNPTNWYTNPLIWSYGISFLQASSHMTESQIPAFITGVTHWESLHMFFLKRRKTLESRCKNCGFVVLSLICFPFLSVSVAWFSWPHLIGTEVIYIMAGIGYRPKFFKEYFRIVEKSESFGNPVIDRFPTSHKDVMAIAPAHVESMKKSHLLSDHPTNGEVFKSIATLKLSAMYLRKRSNIKSLSKSEEGQKSALDTLDIMIAARKGYYGKSNTGKVGHKDSGGNSSV